MAVCMLYEIIVPNGVNIHWMVSNDIIRRIDEQQTNVIETKFMPTLAYFSSHQQLMHSHNV